MAQYIDPSITINLHVTRLATISGLSMTATSSNFAISNPTNSGYQIWLAYVAFGAFSDPSLQPGSTAPSSFAVSWGTNSTTTPNNLHSATAWGSGVILPFCIAQASDTIDPRIYPGQSLYFAITTTTGGLGTMSVGFHGGYVLRP